MGHCVRTITKSKLTPFAFGSPSEQVTAEIRTDDGSDDDDSILGNSGRQQEVSVEEAKGEGGENTIYCVFHDDEDFVEYYDLNANPYQMGNDYHTLNDVQVQRY